MACHTSHIPNPSVSSMATIVDSREPSVDGNGSAKPTHNLGAVIPPIEDQQNRTLILCFDGTGDQFDADNSNVVQFVSLLKKDDRHRQLVYYQTGIGTYNEGTRTISPAMSQLRKIFDTMFAHSIGDHIMGGYKFLMQNYHLGDKICIFGFSRGAYTARCLAGMLHKLGLLPPSNSEQVPFVYTMYLRDDGLGWKQANDFKRAFSINVDVEFLGVWDTVGSIGFTSGLPFVTSTTFIKTYRHAISLDERRARFQVNLWNEPSADERVLGLPDTTKKNRTNIKEVWFAGCHCDVGGGSVSNATRHSLARIPLRWMVREIFEAKAGILFLTDRLGEIGLDPKTVYPDVLKRPDPLDVGELRVQEPSSKEKPIRPPWYSFWKRYNLRYSFTEATPVPALVKSEEYEELMDALTPIYDQMVLKWWWRVLEWLPARVTRQRDDGTWITGWRLWNRGRARAVKQSKKRRLMVHRSVKMRKEARGSKYVPQVKFTEDPEYVE